MPPGHPVLGLAMPDMQFSAGQWKVVQTDTEMHQGQAASNDPEEERRG